MTRYKLERGTEMGVVEERESRGVISKRMVQCAGLFVFENKTLRIEEDAEACNSSYLT